jgi:hypothetical protein
LYAHARCSASSATTTHACPCARGGRPKLDRPLDRHPKFGGTHLDRLLRTEDTHLDRSLVGMGELSSPLTFLHASQARARCSPSDGRTTPRCARGGYATKCARGHHHHRHCWRAQAERSARARRLEFLGSVIGEAGGIKGVPGTSLFSDALRAFRSP